MNDNVDTLARLMAAKALAGGGNSGASVPVPEAGDTGKLLAANNGEAEWHQVFVLDGSTLTIDVPEPAAQLNALSSPRLVRPAVTPALDTVIRNATPDIVEPSEEEETEEETPDEPEPAEEEETGSEEEA